MAIVDKPTDFFNTLLYTGNDGTGRSITGVGFQPDFVWIKDKSNDFKHGIFDVKRGVTKVVSSNSDSVEQTISNSLTAFGTDGFTVGSNALVNGNNNSYASWNWKAGTAISNNAGSPVGTSLASSGSVNTTAGFSVVTYISNGNNYTVPHGLGVAPNVVIVKNRSIDKFWAVYHSSLGNTKATFLDTTAAPDTDATYWQNTTPTSTVFSVGTNSGNNSGNAMVAYSFAEKIGFSKFGQFNGNSSDDGTFIYLGFKPAFVIIKRTNSTGNWVMQDNKRSSSGGFNENSYSLYSNSTTDQITDESELDLLSNGWKFRNALTDNNAAGSTYIYMAFAENPFVSSSGVPGLAR